jgi:hypothetical protein
MTANDQAIWTGHSRFHPDQSWTDAPTMTGRIGAGSERP